MADIRDINARGVKVCVYGVEVRKLVVDAAREMCGRSGLDYANPLVTADGYGGFIVRFMERT